MKKNKKLISIVALVAILVGCFPFSVFASDAQPTEELSVVEEPKITEDIERREESIKHFIMPDGSYKAISYSGAVHRKSSDGEWIDINNDLSIKTIGSKQLYTTNDSRTTFSKSYSSNEDIMTLRENGYVISMALLSEQNDGDMSMDMNDTASLVTVNNSDYIRPASFDTIEDAIEINNRSSISYSNVMKHTDIEYVMNGNDIKENIIVRDRSDSYVYAFRLSLDGLVPVLNENGAIYLNDRDTEETKYVIPAPYMYDANDEYSEAVYYELLPVEGDKYLLLVTADEEWINAEERAFPVTVDPSVHSTGPSADTYVSSTKPMSQHGSSIALWVDNNNTTLINIPLPSIHTSTNAGVFFSAELNINYYATQVFGRADIEVYRISESWSENTVTYRTIPNMEATCSSQDSVVAVEGYNYNVAQISTLNITNSIKSYYDTGKTFYGIALKIPASTNGSAQKAIRIKSRESGAIYAPYIIVTYGLLDIGEKIYRIYNPESGVTIQIDDNDATNNYRTVGAEIEVNSSNNFSPQAWHFVYAHDGLYRILSVNSDMAIAVNSSHLNSSTHVLRQEEYSESSSQLWRVTISSSGNYIFRADSANSYLTDWCMAHGNSTIGVDKVCQRAYTNNSDYADEWNLDYLGRASGRVRMEAQQTEHWCWVTAARMFAMNYSDTFDSSITQSEAVNELIETYYNDEPENAWPEAESFSGGISDARNAVNYFSGHQVFDETFATYYNDHICTEQSLINLINAGHVILVTQGEYIFDMSMGKYVRQKGHSMLIYGYVFVDNIVFFLVRNPSPKDMGTTGLISYTKLCNGQQHTPIENPNDWVWERFLIKANTGVSYTTIPRDSQYEIT